MRTRRGLIGLGCSDGAVSLTHAHYFLDVLDAVHGEGDSTWEVDTSSCYPTAAAAAAAGVALLAGAALVACGAVLAVAAIGATHAAAAAAGPLLLTATASAAATAAAAADTAVAAAARRGWGGWRQLLMLNLEGGGLPLPASGKRGLVALILRFVHAGRKGREGGRGGEEVTDVLVVDFDHRDRDADGC